MKSTQLAFLLDGIKWLLYFHLLSVSSNFSSWRGRGWGSLSGPPAPPHHKDTMILLGQAHISAHAAPFLFSVSHKSQLVSHTCVIICMSDEHPVLVHSGFYSKTAWLIHNRNLFRTILEAGKTKIKVPADSGSGQRPLLGSHMVVFSLGPHVAQKVRELFWLFY